MAESLAHLWQFMGYPFVRYALIVGALLLSALVVFPALAAMSVCRTFKRVTVCAALISVTCVVVGMVASMAFSTPVGSTIVLVDACAYGICRLVGALAG